MNLDFLKDFHKRMKKVGTYALINYNSIYKGTWKNYGFEENYEYINLIFAVMMFIMEQSLKDDICTLDDIAAYIDEINTKFFKKNLTYEQSRNLADFIVNTVLCDDGKAMYFKGYNFREKEYEDIHISFINNKIVYINDTVRRTSYYLTEDGYSLLLGTLEVENNMKLTIQEIIFKLHLDKADYDKAVDDIKQIFNLSRIQLQKIEESIRKIKENVLNFSSGAYENIQDENMDIIKDYRKKFQGYKQYIKEKIQEFYDNKIDLEKLDEEEKTNLNNLGIINQYLSRVIGEQQKILNSHFDFKKAYSNALTGMTAMAAIKRINFNNDLYEYILKDVSKLDALDKILRPLYLAKLPKYYNINKCLQYQKVIKAKMEDAEEEISLDEESFREEKEKELREKLLKYRELLETLLQYLINSSKKSMSLGEIVNIVNKDEKMKAKFIPSVEIFREVMIELLKSSYIDIEKMKKESEHSLEEDDIIDFQLNKMLLSLIEEDKKFSNIKAIEINKLFNENPVKIYGAAMDKGYVKTVTCSNIEFKLH